MVAIAWVQGNGNNNNSQTTSPWDIAFPGDVAEGDTILVCIDTSSESLDPSTPVTDLLGNTYFPVVSDTFCFMFRGVVTTGGPCTVHTNWVGSPLDCKVTVDEYSGIATSGAIVDATCHNASSGPATIADGGNLVTTGNGELLFAFFSVGNQGADVDDFGFTVRQDVLFGSDVSKDQQAAVPGTYPVQSAMNSSGFTVLGVALNPQQPAVDAMFFGAP